MKRFFVLLFLLLGAVCIDGARRPNQGKLETVFGDAAAYNLDDPAADHRSEGIRRSEYNDHTGAVDSFRAAVKFEKMDKGGAQMNLGVSLMRLGNNRDAATAKQIYFDALEAFEKAESMGTNVGDNKKAIYDNCNIRYKEHCDIVFADLRGGVRVLGTFASSDSEEGEEDWEVDDGGESWDESDDDLFAEEGNDERGKSQKSEGSESEDWDVGDEDWAE